ncbi:hypothetical protein ON010_g3694 [Phytophthora cinnamomi]|nr:hypothetical protein ON010_g3694 [Phytophthora cinnamomi]
MDNNKQMELPHRRFGHVAVDTVRRLAHKLNVGVKLNANGLTSYECVACAEGKAERMTHARIPVRKSKPLEGLMMGIFSIKPATVEESKGQATFHINVLINQLRTKFPKYKVVRLWSDQGGGFMNTELEDYSNTYGIELKTTNSYSPQENGIVERPNGVVLLRIRAMLGVTGCPNILLTTPGYKFLDLKTAQIATAQGFNARFHEEFAAHGAYVQHLLENALLDGDHELPETEPVARTKTVMESFLTVQSNTGLPEPNSHSPTEGAADQLGVATPAGLPTEMPTAVSKAAKKRRKRRALSSREQALVPLATCHAGGVSVALRSQDMETGTPQDGQEPEGAIALSANPASTPSRNTSTTRGTCTVEMVVDIMTKALGVAKFTRFRKETKVLPIVSGDSEDGPSQAADEAQASTTTASHRVYTTTTSA